MKYKKTFTLLLLPLATSMLAQQTTAAAGGDGSGSGGSVASTVGQVVYTTNSGSNGSVAEGVQHPYEILTTEVNTSPFSISLNAFPNPTVNSVTLQIENLNNEKINLELFDMQGRMLQTKTITDKQTQIDLSSFSSATYILNIIHNNKKIQSFKLIKK